ncbi:hypothetical protein RDWZM_002346 [Blomia tropicalis]|uniref:Uncharacterized protein n=1 Tax=Blomia tropicalis TaxID=40697 RepID=A0A9Q0MDB6_BLOTA|nr:hypothetical protein RDWZM_002346 [Blomia tropicalis]
MNEENRQGNEEQLPIDLSKVQWETEHRMSCMMNSERDVSYRVPSIGLVTEKWKLKASITGDTTEQQEIALHSVYVNNKLVRQVNIRNNQVVVSDPQYEPYNFLRYGANHSTTIDDYQSNAARNDTVPVKGSLEFEGKPITQQPTNGSDVNVNNNATNAS